MKKWIQLDDGTRVDQEGTKIIWPDGKLEEVDATRWKINENGTKIRKFGGMYIIWPDGRMEILDKNQWAWRKDGAFVKKDHTKIINTRGDVEEFNLKEWEVTEHGTMKKKDGTRIIWSDGMEWDAKQAGAFGF